MPGDREAVFARGRNPRACVWSHTCVCVPADRRMSVYEREECVRAGGP